jgi:hypothetical protein
MLTATSRTRFTVYLRQCDAIATPRTDGRAGGAEFVRVFGEEGFFQWLRWHDLIVVDALGQEPAPSPESPWLGGSMSAAPPDDGYRIMNALA